MESFNANITIITQCTSSSIGNTLLSIPQCRPGTIPSALTATRHINTIQDLDGFSPPPSLTNIWHAHCHVRNTRKAATTTHPPGSGLMSQLCLSEVINLEQSRQLAYTSVHRRAVSGPKSSGVVSVTTTRVTALTSARNGRSCTSREAWVLPGEGRVSRGRTPWHMLPRRQHCEIETAAQHVEE